MNERPSVMEGAYFPGDSTVELREVAVPTPGPRQVLLRTGASGICGSDLKLAYRQHMARGTRTYRNVVGGHEPSGRIIEAGENCARFSAGDRVLVYHISGCGNCRPCRAGYMIMCQAESRRAYGGQRDGGHAPFMLVDESTCIPLPDQLSYVDGSFIACGFGTVYEAFLRLQPNGCDRVLIVGLGPVGAAAAMVARLFGVAEVFGIEPSEERLCWSRSLGLFTEVAASIEGLDGMRFEVALDCSGTSGGRRQALESLCEWGRCGLVGEGGLLEVEASDLVLHKQATITGSWVTSLPNMEQLTVLLAESDWRPEQLVTARYPLHRVSEAYERADAGDSGKVCLVFD